MEVAAARLSGYLEVQAVVGQVTHLAAAKQVGQQRQTKATQAAAERMEALEQGLVAALAQQAGTHLSTILEQAGLVFNHQLPDQLPIEQEAAGGEQPALLEV